MSSVDEGKSKNLLLVGGGSGIATAVTRKAMLLGWNIVVTERSSMDTASSARSDLGETPSQLASHEGGVGTVKSVHLNLENGESVKNLVAGLMRNGTKLDGIVFAGAMAHGGRIGMVPEEQVERVLRVNLMSWIDLSQRLLRIMKSPASIVFITSDSAQTAIPGNFLYGASKAAVERFAKSLALEAANRGVRVNCVSPTLVDTPMLEEMDHKSRAEVLSRAFAERVLTPDEVASSILFLLNSESSAISGQTLYLGEYAR